VDSRIPRIFVLVLFAWLFWVCAKQMQTWSRAMVDASDLQAMAVIGGTFFLVLALLCIGCALIYSIQAATDWGIERWRETTEIAQQSGHLRIIQAISHLTADQAKLAPHYQFIQTASQVTGPGHRVEYLITPEGNVKLDDVVMFLKKSDNVYVYHIGWTSDKTDEREAIHAFTSWCVWNGFAEPPAGPHAARWVLPESRAACAVFLGVKLLEELPPHPTYTVRPSPVEDDDEESED
jgi:hypothetical protein